MLRYLVKKNNVLQKNLFNKIGRIQSYYSVTSSNNINYHKQTPEFELINDSGKVKNDNNTRIVFVTKESWKGMKEEYPRWFNKEFKAKPGQTIVDYKRKESSDEYETTVLTGLGSLKELLPEQPFCTNDEYKAEVLQAFRAAVYHATNVSKSRLKTKSVVVEYPDFMNEKIEVQNENKDNSVQLDKKEVLQAITQVLTLSNYKFDKYLINDKEENKKEEEEKEEKEEPIETVQILNESFENNQIDNLRDIINSSRIVADSTLFTRDLGNEQADVANPEFLEEKAHEIVREFNESNEQNDVKMTIKVIKGNELKERGMNLIYSVGQAAQWEPRLVIIEYIGDQDNYNNKDNHDVISLVGKGVTFDTGGLNLKPTGFMETMHMDMCGSASVLGTMRALSRLKIKKNIIAGVGLVENSIDSVSYKPGAIIKSLKGTTVEIGNTDAEGRLVLADSLTYIQDQYKPHTVINLATLTGACVVALGEYSTGVFSNNSQLQNQLISAGNSSFDRAWPLPIFPEHVKELETTHANLSSTGSGRYGGASTAAGFLKHFINKNVKWSHLDIAGSAMYSKPRLFLPKGSTGSAVHLLCNFLNENNK
eukprot:TRINITY_DN5939_c1_g2_i1.p1 TRINITY_DN5939_c1_g2~~TRINITY_DN5939_c1_g2_i1.p1  ORF type:complete len:594 (-),score=197.72 TRINITY_DN5939_c1_g2_i1:187-1968(-)